MTSAGRHRRASPLPERQRASAEGRIPLVGRLLATPAAAKVPEVIFAFWVVKVLTTAGGEATSDYLKNWGNIKGGGTEVVVFLAGLVLQFATRRYRAFAYWFLAFAIAIFGTGVSDFLHLDVHWATVFATFALGTALGDFTATSLNLGYLASGIAFGVIILLPALAWRRFGLDPIAAFWASYVVTRPLGASFADYISKPKNISGINFGDGPTAIAFAVAVLLLVVYLAIARPDIQRAAVTTERPATVTPDLAAAGEPERDAQ